jgi:peptide/nickel transport system ATP-binding protein
MSEALLSVQNLRVAYPHRQSLREPPWVVDDVSLTLEAGERLGLVGESGCGKSTIGRTLLQLLPPGTKVTGEVAFAGKPIFGLSSAQRRRFRGESIALVFQDPMTRLDPLMTIKDHCLETLQAHQPRLSQRQAEAQILETLEAVKIPADRWTQYPHEFSGGMRQRVAIALALLLNPQMIVADEPTTSLDVTIAAQILQELTRLCQERRMALLLISHDLALVSEYCDRVAVMYQGKVVETGPAQALLRQPQHAYTQSLVESAMHLQAEPAAVTATAASKVLLRIQDLKQYYSLETNFIARLISKQDLTIKAVDGVSLELHAGEILGLVGESGCGKSTLSRTILQLVRPTSGRVEFAGIDLANLAQPQVRPHRRQIQMIFQDPHACLNPLMTVGQSIADPLLIHHLATPAAAQEQARGMLHRVGLTPTEDYYHRYPADLSGGQQQRVAIARALITQPQLLICDEPVSMLDASIQTQVLELMLELKREFNLTYLFITHDLWVARFFCDRIAVMHAGKIVETGPTETIFTQPQHPYTQKLLAAAPLLSRLHELEH